MASGIARAPWHLTVEAFLFDMDGTLVDSGVIVENAWANWARPFHLNLAELLAFSHGRPTIATMEHFGARFAPGKDWAQDAEDMLTYECQHSEGTVPIPGSLELLQHLNAVGAPWAVVTSAPRQLAEGRIAAAGLPLPRVLVPVDEISNGKPHPEGFLKAALELGCKPSACVVIEDTPPGVEAGLNAGMQVIGILTTVTAERLKTTNLIRNYFDMRVERAGATAFEIEFLKT